MPDVATATQGDRPIEPADANPRGIYVMLGFFAFLAKWLPMAYWTHAVIGSQIRERIAMPLGGAVWEGWPILIIGVALMFSGLANFNRAVRQAMHPSLNMFHKLLCFCLLIISAWEVWLVVQWNGAAPFVATRTAIPFITPIHGHETVLPITPILLLAGAIVALMPRITVHLWSRSVRWG